MLDIAGKRDKSILGVVYLVHLRIKTRWFCRRYRFFIIPRYDCLDKTQHEGTVADIKKKKHIERDQSLFHPDRGARCRSQMRIGGVDELRLQINMEVWRKRACRTDRGPRRHLISKC